MTNKLKVRTPSLVIILLVFGIGYALAHNKVVVLPMSGGSSVAGYSLEFDNLSQFTNPGFYADNTVSCPTGKKVLGGGCTTDPENRVAMIASNPFSSGNAWFCRFKNVHDVQISITVKAWAICADTES